jgi:simple sugar transport system permease protein
MATAATTWRKEVRTYFGDSYIAGPLVTLIVIFVLFSLFVPNFFTLRSISGILNAATLVGVVTIGVTMLMISGEFDLSVGPMLAMGGYMYGFGADNGWPIVGVALALLIPGLMGAVNGLIFISTGIPSFIVTLGTRSIYRGIVWVVSGGAMLQLLEDLIIYGIFNGRFDLLNNPLKAFFDQPANFRTSFLWLVGLIILFQYILTRTRFGNHTLAIGGNPGAAAAQGVNVRRTKVFNFIVTGLLSGLAGVLLFSQFKTIRVASGALIELDAIAAAVVGGTLLTGGGGSIWGALIGVLLISVLRTGVVLLDLPFIGSDNFLAVVGVTIIVAVVLNNWIRKLA